MGHVKRFWLVAVLPIILCGASFASFTCNGNTYAKRYKLVIPHQIVPSNQSSFPFPFCFNGGCTNAQSLPDLKTVGNGGAVNNTANNSVSISGPADVDVCDAATGGSHVKWESEAGYSASTGKAKFWIQTNPNATTDYAVWLFIGASGVTTSQQDLSLWTDANYKLVCHYGDSSTLNYTCSVGGTGTAVATPTAAASQIDGGIALASASSQAVNYGNSSNFDVTGGFTIESWSLYTSGALQCILCKMDSSSSTGGGYAVYSGDGSAGNITLQVDNGAGLSLVRSSGSRSAGYHYIVASSTSSPTTGNMKLYDNGVSQSFGATLFNATGIGTTANNLNLGRFPAGTSFYSNGTIDEVRLNSTVLSQDWITLTYRAQAQLGGSFVVYDANEPAGLSAGGNCVPAPIDHTKVPNTDRSNFPFLKVGAWPWMADITHGGYAINGNSGNDIRWYSDSACTTLIPFQVAYYDSTTGDYAVWASLATVSHSTDTIPYISIGRTGDTSNVQNASGVWGSNGYVHVMQWGSPKSQSLTSVGSDGITMSSSGSPTNSVGPQGASIFFPVGTSAVVNFDPPSPFLLSTYGFPVGSTARSMVTAWRATTETSAQAVTQTGASLGGFGCSPHGGGCGAVSNDTGFNWDRQNPNTGPACGFSLGTIEGSSPSVYKSCTEFDDFGWHVNAIAYTPGGAQINAGTVKLYIDSLVGSPSFISGTTVANTTDGGTLNSSEVAWGRVPAHSDDFFTGFLGTTLISSNVIDGDTVTTFKNNWLSSQTFSSWGTAAPISGSSGTAQPVITIITKTFSDESVEPSMFSRSQSGIYRRDAGRQ